MNDNITIRGIVATDPRHILTEEGLSVTSFRIITTSTEYDADADAWRRTHSNWFTVTADRQLASNVAGCVSRGDPLLVSGRLRVCEWSTDDGRCEAGVTAEIEADAIGHDLAWGCASFSRTVARPGAGAEVKTRPSADAPADASAVSTGDVSSATAA